jgi:hypothetical protein
VHPEVAAEAPVPREVIPEIAPATRFHCGIGGPALDTCPRPADAARADSAA